MNKSALSSPLEYTSTLFGMCMNPNHSEFKIKAYNKDEPMYVWNNHTVYSRKVIWNKTQRQWLSENGVTFNEDCTCYVPIGNVDDDYYLTGWHTHYPNFSNRLLVMSDTARTAHYKNLFFTQVGNHPYPKHTRWHSNWIIDNFHRECHRIIYPDPDPKKFFLSLDDVLP